MPDNRDVYYHYESLSSQLTSATNWVRTHKVDPTAIDTFYSSTPSSTTDVLVKDSNYTSRCELELGVEWTSDGYSGLLGYMTCEAAVSNPSSSAYQRCEQAAVRVHDLVVQERDQWFERYLMCHEGGHALGLGHRHDSNTHYGCMPDGATGHFDTIDYNSHDTTHWTEFNNAAS